MKKIIYPRGFIGFYNEQEHEKDSVDINEIITSIKFNTRIDKVDTTPFNTEVENIFNSLVGGEENFTKFDFREECLEVCLNSFGTHDFYEWCITQLSSPYLSSLHKQFINDTFNFIDTGKRNVSVESWVSLLYRNKQEQTKSTELRLHQFFGLKDRLNNRRITHICDIVNNWVKHEGGFNDLVYTCYILFGPKQ